MITVSLAGLRAIEALATHGSMTAAAGALGYTPSAISQQIARLERDVRQTLIERQGRRVTLTIAGRILAESASRIVIELESMNAELQAQTETVTGSLKIAAFPTAARLSRQSRGQPRSGLHPRAERWSAGLCPSNWRKL